MSFGVHEQVIREQALYSGLVLTVDQITAFAFC